MKQKFSTSWNKSKQKRKQIKYRMNAPLHLRKKMVSIGLNKELRKKHSKRSVPARKGDLIKIISGKLKGKTGKIESLDLKKLKVYVEGIQLTKQDGNKMNSPLDPSNLQITELNLADKKRIIVKEKPKTKEKKKKINNKPGVK